MDLAIRIADLKDSSLQARLICPIRLVICASPAYLDLHGRPRDPDQLRQHNCLSLPDISWRFRFPESIRSVKVGGSLTSDNGRALVAAAVRGVGIVRFPEYYVQQEISRGELEPVLENYEVQDAATWIIYADRHHLPTRVRYLIDFLVKRLRAMDGQTIRKANCIEDAATG